MKAMVLERIGQPLVLNDYERASPTPGHVLIEVAACAVCRTDLHVIDGDLPSPKLPLIPGHEIIGYVRELGSGVKEFEIGDRVGVPWLGGTCHHCDFCNTGRENLCDDPQFTGYQVDGGYASHAIANADYCFTVPECYDDIHAAPLMCAGLIGYRCYNAVGAAKKIGLFGFGAAAHILAQVAIYQDRDVYAFVRPGDVAARTFALDLGCAWAGDSTDLAPALLDAAIIFAPVGPLVPLALQQIRKGGTLVLGGIHMSPIPKMSYELLWGERVVRSIANLTREDGHRFLELAASVPIQMSVETFALDAANTALDQLRQGLLTGAAVLLPD